MAENKRYIALDEGYDLMIRDTITHNDLCDVDSVVDELNQLSEQNNGTKYNELINNIFKDYEKAFARKMIPFSEFVIIENILIKIQTGLKVLDDES